MRVGEERVVENDLVEVVRPGQVDDRPGRDARRLHVDEELGQPMPPVFLGRRRGAQQRDHVIGLMRVAGPDLAPADQPSAVGLGRPGRGGEHVGARIGLAEPDAETEFAARDLRQDLLLYLLLAVAEDDRAALPVGGRMRSGRRAGRQHFLRHDIALEMRALVAAIFFGPGHADPPLGADLAAELARERALAAVRREGAGLDLLAQKGADLPAQFLGFGRQLDRVEAEGGVHPCLTNLG